MDVEGMTRRIEDQVRAAQAHADRMKAWAGRIEQVTGEGTALRGAVRVSVNNAGVVTSLHLTDAALEGGPAALSGAILAAITAAKQAVADETGRSAVAEFGRDGEVTHLMVADLSKRFGVTPDIDPKNPFSGRPGQVLG
ncbi:MAG TPA: YbaB/EbfC family nucleoid-associated protein [Dermatophilaceae bacterium]|jgi:DNA-binding protein YbaB|nr:YbaB/EbfC family nucleoid-associated protein [Actinomycetales bacterium]HMT32899.1 YbaB/EbfC family nucleoid-associated protein [Dermatophilaceae bacterium]HMT89891.1 YbaB/EbfC family nucleoid-associated protein [Dermatophilaceae bacterium]